MTGKTFVEEKRRNGKRSTGRKTAEFGVVSSKITSNRPGPETKVSTSVVSRGIGLRT